MTDLVPGRLPVGSAAPSVLYIPSGEDRFGEHHGIGIGRIDFKLSSLDTDMFIAEARLHARGGPAKHLHTRQDEWFYVAEGEFVIEIGEGRFQAKAGDSLYSPRNVPHTWAFTGEGTGRLLFAFNPPGKMEEFFRELATLNAVAPTDPDFWRRFDLEYVGPPLKLE